MSLNKLSAINFGTAEAEFDHKLLQTAFFETEQWKKINSEAISPLIVGRKGSGKSAIALRLRFQNESNNNYLSLVPNEFRHVEVRELLSHLINTNVTWQYIYTKVWEGIILGQITRHLLMEENKKLYYDISDDLNRCLKVFKEKCSFYLNALDDSLCQILEEYLLSNEGKVDSVSLVALRKRLEPYKWDVLVNTINTEFIEATRKHKKIIFCIDGLDEHWDVAEPSLYFLAQLLHVIKTFSLKFKDSVSFYICLRDNIFRTLVDTNCVEYDKLEASINYLVWDSFSLFSLIGKRAFPLLPEAEAIKNLKDLLPESIDGMSIEDYVGRHIINRPRDFINFFKHLQAKCGDKASAMHVKDAIAHYCANRMVDLENEFGFTYPKITEVIGALYGLPNKVSKDELKKKLNEICVDESIRSKAKELMLHHGQPETLARILISIGVLGIYDKNEDVVKFIHEFSESRVAKLYELNEQFGVHPVYAYTIGDKKTDLGGQTAKVAPVFNPSDYMPVRDNLKDLIPIAERTKKIKTVLIHEIAAIKKGQQNFKRFEIWVQKTLEICFMTDLSGAKTQVPSSEGRQIFEILFDINGNEQLWQEIKNKYQTHRLLIECKNTDIPTDDDLNKLSRDMDLLDLKVAFIVYRSEQREPSKPVLDKIRDRWNSSKKEKVMIVVTEAFLIQCLNKPDETKCRKNLNALWRDHLETWLVG